MIDLGHEDAVELDRNQTNVRLRSETEILIVGAGPVGLTLALLLAKRGRRVAVYERWAEAYPLPRAAAMSMKRCELSNLRACLTHFGLISILNSRNRQHHAIHPMVKS